MFGLTGSMASDCIEGYVRSGVTLVHVIPPSLVFHTPPRSAPTYIVEASVGCGASVKTRPANGVSVVGSRIGSGPIGTHSAAVSANAGRNRAPSRISIGREPRGASGDGAFGNARWNRSQDVASSAAGNGIAGAMPTRGA